MKKENKKICVNCKPYIPENMDVAIVCSEKCKQEFTEKLKMTKWKLVAGRLDNIIDLINSQIKSKENDDGNEEYVPQYEIDQLNKIKDKVKILSDWMKKNEEMV